MNEIVEEFTTFVIESMLYFRCMILTKFGSSRTTRSKLSNASPMHYRERISLFVLSSYVFVIFCMQQISIGRVFPFSDYYDQHIEHARIEKPLTLNRLCAVHHRGKWLRATITRISNDEITVRAKKSNEFDRAIDNFAIRFV